MTITYSTGYATSSNYVILIKLVNMIILKFMSLKWNKQNENDFNIDTDKQFVPQPTIGSWLTAFEE